MGVNPKARGERSEAHILAAVVERGYAPSIPFGNNQRYDIILDDGKNLLRIQCKTGWVENGSLIFQTSSKNGFTGKRTAYTGQIDFFLVYSPETKKVYKVPVEAAPKNCMYLRLETLKSNAPKKSVHWAKEFEF